MRQVKLSNSDRSNRDTVTYKDAITYNCEKRFEGDRKQSRLKVCFLGHWGLYVGPTSEDKFVITGEGNSVVKLLRWMFCENSQVR